MGYPFRCQEGPGSRQIPAENAEIALLGPPMCVGASILRCSSRPCFLDPRCTLWLNLIVAVQACCGIRDLRTVAQCSSDSLEWFEPLNGILLCSLRCAFAQPPPNAGP